MTFDFVCADCDWKLVIDLPDDLDPLLRFGREASFDRLVAEHIVDCANRG